MKKFSFYQAGILLLLLATLNGCAVVGGIFKTGMWAGILVVVGVILLIIWLIRKGMK